MKNVLKTIEKTKLLGNDSIRLGEIRQIFELSKGEMFEAICCAYSFGFAIGQKREKMKQKKKSSQGAGTTKRAKSE